MRENEANEKKRKTMRVRDNEDVPACMFCLFVCVCARARARMGALARASMLRQQEHLEALRMEPPPSRPCGQDHVLILKY